jgi:hypothetical protein
MTRWRRVGRPLISLLALPAVVPGAISCGGSGGSSAGAERWILDSTTSISGMVPTLIGAPAATDTDRGTSLCFDGDDAVVLARNPVEGMTAFTLELLFRPDAVTTAEPALAEPRIVHVETAEASRATIEARVGAADFYLDTFLLSGTQSLTLVDATRTHPVGQWHWAALTYDGAQMRHFVDGAEDAAGAVAIAPLGAGSTSIGVRQNLVYWFKGCAHELRASAGALGADRLQRP